MKTIKKLTLVLVAILMAATTFAQDKRKLDNYRSPDKDGINVFEAPKDTVSTFDGIKVRVGGASALQFQALDHENSGAVELIEIGDNFNLATANLDLDVALADGLRMHLRTYLSSRHHPEPYVKGGYMQIDNFNFLSEGFLAETMKYVTIKFGHMENNYGDAHFRRSDNAQAFYNPFVGNYIMDSFTTEVGGEIYFQKNGFLGMVGVSNGKLNQAVNRPKTTSPSLLMKLGYDKQMNDDLRVRVTGSLYHTAHTARTWLYAGDRAGSRYYLVMELPDASSAGNFTSGRFNPSLNNQLTAVMINPFIKYKGFEFFGMYERSEGKAASEEETRVFTQLGAEALYRFGSTENFYIGGRFNQVSGELLGSGEDIDITRVNFGGGWFMTKNVLAKIEYVNQTYDGFATGDRFDEGKFNGLMIEAVISF
ncbi:hypothetical protein [Planktosalinus lacus]|uniref:Porin n=1 Tax=Planktosalinus lacus TaxID=1526573 RepID=A0A8J2V9X9_9FLAO|nr:hypothetical protein [Planktosalinus lacus]GGD91607.1 hypothetical protein GCM10011312_14230 [Planktosalinus lacus]